MNKKCFRVIFSKTLQRLIVTSELAKAEGKAKESNSFSDLQIFARIRPLVFSLFCALGLVSTPTLAETLIIQADKSAPKHQQPIILQTANGLPQVNIQTPNDKGLSHNKYSKFDVDTKGAILNNSRTNVQTQQAGWVQGNPHLARGEAKVILNEVNSNDPSLLKGYVEVAGKKADVIIANPSGIHCQGCGIINSDRATFTTGKPHIQNGNLESFVVEKGKVSIDGKGLDNSRVDYTEILAREVQANAGVWSKKETKVITGKNTLKRSDSAKDLQIIHSNQPLADEAQPQFAVDVGELGGMYSGKIHLIGTEQGVGVRNAGHIGASGETLTIDSKGRIINTGTLNANQAINLTATKGIANTGKIENRQGDIQLNTKADIKQDGSIVARQGNIHKHADTTISQQGETVAKGDVRYQAQTINASQDSLIAAGVTIQDNHNGEVRTLDTQSAQGRSLQVSATDQATLQGKNIASGTFNLHAGSVNVNHSQNSAHTIVVQGTTGNIEANSALFTAQADLQLKTPKALSTQSSHLTANNIRTEQASLNAQNATWKQTGTDDFHLKGNELITSGAAFSTQGDFKVDANQLDNVQGTLSSAKSLTLKVEKTLNSEGGQLLAGEDLQLTTSNLNNDRGLVYAKQSVEVVATESIRNQNTNSDNKGIVAGQGLSLKGKDIDNAQGKIASQQLAVETAQLRNDEGLLYAQETLNLNATQATNHQGLITVGKQASLSLSQLEQKGGQIEAQALEVNADDIRSTDNSLIFAENLKLTTQSQLANQESRIVAKNDGQIVTGGFLDNQRGTIGSQTGSLTLNTHHHNLDNTQGNLVAAQQLRLDGGTLTNEQGLVSAKQVVLNASQAIDNRNTQNADNPKGIVAQNALEINAKHLNNNNGKVRVGGQLDLNSETFSQVAGLVSASVLNLIAKEISSTQGSEISGNTATLMVDTLNNRDSKLVTQQAMTVEAKSGIQNQGGVIASLDSALSINTQQSALNNAKGVIAAQKATLNLQTGNLDNQQGSILAKQATINTHQHTLDNRNTLTESSQGIVVENLTLDAGLLNNQHGRVTAKNSGTIDAQEVQNQSGEILAKNSVQLNSTQVNNQAGTIASTEGNLHITTRTTLENQQGQISAADQLTLDTHGLANQQGNVVSSNQLTLNTHQHAIDNQQGKIFAQQHAEVNSGAVNNQQGLIRADKQLSLNTHAQQLDNRHTQGKEQGVVGLGDVVLNGISNLLNQQGTLYADNALNAVTQNNVNNTQGIIQSNNQLTLSASSIDNQAGKITAKFNNLTANQINNRASGRDGSLILGDTLTLNVQQLDNQGTKATTDVPTQGIQATHLTLRADTLSNQQGGIYTAETANLTATTRLDNTQGELLSGNHIDIKHTGQLMLNNQEGLIQGVNQVNLNAKGLESEGHIKTAGDLAIGLKDSFTLNNAFEVGNNLTFNTEGDFENNTVQRVKNKATFTANRITNHANAEISANDTTLNSQELTNRGLIDGITTRINSTSVTNIGTGRIYGNHLAFKSQTINNLAETINSETKAGTIAAREKLDVGVGTLTNRDHALILSLGDLSIGGDLDSEGNAIGKATFVDNGSATIEALRNGLIETEYLKNHNLKFSTKQIALPTTYHTEYATSSSGEKLSGGRYDRRSGEKDQSYATYYTEDGKRIDSREWWIWNYRIESNKTEISSTDPAKILIGGSLGLFGNIENDKSQIIIGNNLLSESSKVNNKDDDGTMTSVHIGTFTHSYVKKSWYKRKKRPRRFETTHNYTAPQPGHNFKLGAWTFLENVNFSEYSTQSSITSPVSANEVDLETITIKPINEFTLNSESGTTLSIPNENKTHITLTSSLDNKSQVINSGQVIGKLDTTIEGSEVKDLGNLKLPTIKTHLADIALPQASLYQINPDNPTYLVETDPRFTQRDQWLSSDYMLNQLRYDHNLTHKRLGDGFYEQRLINEQINQLTGRRFIEGYHSDLEQYRALMNNGLKYAQQFNLAIGVGLTAQQMSELTTDMVWLVNKEVTLPNGQKVTALTPQVYLVARNSDITSRGAVISANEIVGNVGELKNSGVIAGRDLTRIHSNQLENHGVILGQGVNLSAKQNLINLGGRIEAVDSLSLAAGKKLEIASTLSHAQSGDGNFERTIVDQLGSVKVTGDNGHLNLHSDGNLTIKGALVESNGTLRTEAKDIDITTLHIKNKEHYNGDADNYYRLDQQAEVGSQLIADKGVTLIAEKTANLRQAELSSLNGNVTVGALQGDVNIEAGRAEEQLATAMKSTSKGLLSKTTETRRYEHHTNDAVGSSLDGQNMNVIAEKGAVNIKGSSVVAEQDLNIFGKEGVSVLSDVDTRYQQEESQKTKKGLMSSGGGFGFTVGRKKETIESDLTKERTASSQVGSLQGNTTIVTDGHYQQTGSVVTSRDGDVDILAKTATVEAARSEYESNYKRTFEQKGITVAVNIPAVQAIQAVASAVNSAKAVGSSKSNRINALGAVNAGFEAWRAGQQVGQIANALSQNPTEAMSQGVSVSITYGEQKSVETQHSKGNTVEKSAINAGGKATIRTEGAGSDSHITIAGADVAGKGGTTLSAEGDVNIIAVDENHLERSKNKSSGFNVGVAISYGSSGFAFGVTAGGNVAKGYGNGESQAWVGSQVGSRESHTEIASGGDTNVIGSQVQGQKIKLKAENLNIQSLQDTMKYEGKQESASAQVTVGYGASGSASYSKSKMKADMATVNQQAGIFAGDEGYEVDIANHTDLTGGLVTSSQKAESEGKNRFSTGTLSSKEIANHAEHKGSAISVSGSAAANFDTPLGKYGQEQSSKTVTDEKGNTQLATGKDSLQMGASVGIGLDKDSQRSQTKSGINTANLTIRDEQVQLAKTGKTAAETQAAIKTDITLETAEANSGKLESRFDKEKVLKELNIQVKATKEFRQNAFSTIDAYVLPKQAELRQKVKEAKTEEEKTELYKEIYKLQYQKRLLETTVGIIAGTPDVAITQGTLQLAATKMREETLANSRIFQGIKDEKTGQVLRNDSYDSGYFDGVKLGGVRIDLDVICSTDRCGKNADGSITYKGNEKLPTLSDAINPDKNKQAANLYGETGGFQSVEGEWNLHFTRIPYSIGSLSDQVVESFAGTHDMIGGQIWGWYDKQGNTLQNKNVAQHIGSTATTVIAIPVAAPFAVSDAISPDFMEILFKLGGN